MNVCACVCMFVSERGHCSHCSQYVCSSIPGVDMVCAVLQLWNNCIITLLSLKPALARMHCLSQACICILISLYPAVFFTIGSLIGGKTYQNACGRMYSDIYKEDSSVVYQFRLKKMRICWAGGEWYSLAERLYIQVHLVVPGFILFIFLPIYL